MRLERYCGVCHEKTYKEFCWRCQERSNRTNRAIAKKMLAKQVIAHQKKNEKEEK